MKCYTAKVTLLVFKNEKMYKCFSYYIILYIHFFLLCNPFRRLTKKNGIYIKQRKDGNYNVVISKC